MAHKNYITANIRYSYITTIRIWELFDYGLFYYCIYKEVLKRPCYNQEENLLTFSNTESFGQISGSWYNCSATPQIYAKQRLM